MADKDRIGGAENSDDEDIWGMLGGSVEEEKEASVTLVPAASSAPARVTPPTQTPASVATRPPVESKPAVDPTAFFWNPRRRGARGVPANILDDQALNAAIALRLPSTHDFEVHRTVWKLRNWGKSSGRPLRSIGLQMPEGLQRWGTAVADILLEFVESVETTTILGDVTFGACCIDDLACQALGVDYMVHYGHSCIVPVDQTVVTLLYVHVEVSIDVDHLVETVKLNFEPGKRLAFMGTVQFTSGILQATKALEKEFFSEGGSSQVPQVKPLHVGEVLGCTSPVLVDVDIVVFVCDGRFHLESAMIQNPQIKGGFFRYDPYALTLSAEGFAYSDMHASRQASITAAKDAKLVGLILSTLGRQGSTGVLEEVERLLVKQSRPHFTLLLSDVSPERLALFKDVDAWVQVACPRLSLDWGDAFTAPLLTPYEAHIAFGEQKYKEVYPMDYYSNKGGPWSNYGAHNGHGGSLSSKFQHLGRKRVAVEYEHWEDTGKVEYANSQAVQA